MVAEAERVRDRWVREAECEMRPVYKACFKRIADAYQKLVDDLKAMKPSKL